MMVSWFTQLISLQAAQVQSKVVMSVPGLSTLSMPCVTGVAQDSYLIMCDFLLV